MKRFNINLLFFVVFITISNFVSAQNSLSISDPKISWSKYGKGSIDDAVFIVEPKGIYSEVSLFLTFSSKATSMNLNTDTLETVFNFNLPANSLVTDSWLWVNNDIIQAKIMDKWTARNIYEGIVKRRQDPSILTKNGNQYELRIFPVLGNQARKVKIKMLLPNVWNSDGNFSVNLPLNILNAASNSYCGYNGYYSYNYCTSTSGIPSLAKVLVKGNSNFLLSNESISKFTTNIDTLNAVYKYTTVDRAVFSDNFSIKFKSQNIKEGVFLNTYKTSSTEGFYQLVFFPNKTLNLPVKRKTAFIIDYEANKSTITPSQLFSNLKNYIVNNYTEKDSFAIFFGGFIIEGTGNKWISGDSLTKATIFSKIDDSKIKTYSTLNSLLSKSSEFVNENNGGDIVIISASEHNYNASNSNTLINDYVATLPITTRVYSIDLLTNYSNYNWYNNSYLYGDAYFYQTLCRLTSGMQTSLLVDYSNNKTPNGYNEMLNKILQELTGKIATMDVHTTLLNGFCYDRLNFNTIQNISINSPIIQTGKFSGSMPLIINLSGSYNGNSFYKNIAINENEISTSDSITKTIWNGKFILESESNTQSNSMIGSIINLSLKNRILSNYTAFLALEPSQGGQVCSTCIDESTIAGLEDINKDSVEIEAYPNPTSSITKIIIKDKYINNNDVKVSITNLLGENIITFDNLTDFVNNNKIEFSFDVNDYSNLINGVYLLKYSSSSNTKIIKIIVNK
ncbi:MAG: hypothetical protein RLZZ175_2499 [Bacteroidota bacterium]|jgi:hypothetical protein